MNRAALWALATLIACLVAIAAAAYLNSLPIPPAGGMPTPT